MAWVAGVGEALLGGERQRRAADVQGALEGEEEHATSQARTQQGWASARSLGARYRGLDSFVRISACFGTTGTSWCNFGWISLRNC